MKKVAVVAAVVHLRIFSNHPR